jgi:hypothetical protein
MTLMASTSTRMFVLSTMLLNSSDEGENMSLQSILVSYIMLSEMGVASIEAIVMVHLIRYLKTIEQMEDG